MAGYKQVLQPAAFKIYFCTPLTLAAVNVVAENSGFLAQWVLKWKSDPL